MKKVKFFFFAIFVTVVVVFVFKPKKEIEWIPMSFDRLRRPLIEVQIQGQQRTVLFNTGSKLPLTLFPSTMGNIEKKEVGEVSWTNFDDEKFTSSKFSIGALKLGSKKFGSFEACVEREDDEYETLGRPFLEKSNVFFDYHRKSLWLVPSKNQLKKIGFDSSKFTKVPFTISDSGILFNVDTDIGRLLFTISTAETHSYISAKLFEHSGELKIFRIGDRDYGEKRFFSVSFPEKLEIDGSLGLDFLKKHVIYIDYKNRFLYFGQKETNYTFGNSKQEFDIECTQGGCPTIKTWISGEKSRIFIDTGFTEEISVDQEYYNSVSGDKLLKYTLFDFRGNGTECSQKNLTQFQIGKMEFKNILILPMEKNFSRPKSQSGGVFEPPIQAVIGRAFLEKVNMYFDFPNAKMFFTNQKISPPSKNPIPFVVKNGLIILEVITEKGPMRLFLDTGTSHNILRSSEEERDWIKDRSQYFVSEAFQIGGHEYGPQKIAYVNLTEEFKGVDGILGMKFLRNYKLYIDYPNRVLYLSE